MGYHILSAAISTDSRIDRAILTSTLPRMIEWLDAVTEPVIWSGQHSIWSTDVRMEQPWHDALSVYLSAICIFLHSIWEVDLSLGG